MSRRVLVCTAASACLGPASLVAADVIISNLPGNDGTSTFLNAPAGGANGGGVHDSKAAGFTMPAGDPWTLDFVTLRLHFFDTASVPMVQIYSNVNNNPGTLIQTLTAPPFTVTTDQFDFTPATPLTLAGGETYWIVVWNNASGLNSFRWMANTPSVAPTGIATNAGYRFNNGPPPPTTNSTTLNSYSVNATQGGGGCYANCDGSTTEPILNVADFTCFLTKFAAGDPYANCDGSTTEPILNVADFTCFLTKFAAGC
jgi:hypothetical protein